MPNFDAGHYFLTMLAPVKPGMSTVAGKPGFSHRQTVLDQLASMKNSETSVTSRRSPDESPFARNTMTHLARFVLINTPPYNGRESGDTLLSKVFSSGDTILSRCFSIGDPDRPQMADSLGVPYLLFAADFDAPNGEDASLRKFTDTLWATMEDELKPIFSQCYGFETVTDAAGFFAYVKKCQVETTMPFNDYWRPQAVEQLSKMEMSLPLPGAGGSSSSGGPGIPWLQIGIAALGFWLICLVLSLFLREGTQALHVTNWVARWGLVAIIALVALVAVFLWWTYRKIVKAGAQVFPPGATLPDVLKSIYLQQAFLDFVVANQGRSDAELQAAFGQFVAAHAPDSEAAPTQRPGLIRTRNAGVAS
jgi:hypothetical protein